MLFGCALTTAYGSVFKDSKINLNRKNKILITGGGMIGQSILFLITSEGQAISILEKNIEKINFIKKNYPGVNIIKTLDKIKKSSIIDNSLLRHLTIKYKQLDTETEYFKKKDINEKKK